jgi:sialic acid synthase SpsE
MTAIEFEIEAGKMFDRILELSKKDDFLIKGTIWEGKNLHKLYQEAYTPWEWHKILFKTAKDEALVCFSSTFVNTAVDLLESLNTPAYKIASFEITDIPLIEYTALEYYTKIQIYCNDQEPLNYELYENVCNKARHTLQQLLLEDDFTLRKIF